MEIDNRRFSGWLSTHPHPHPLLNFPSYSANDMILTAVQRTLKQVKYYPLAGEN
jgi:hypothetical protein